MNNEWHQKNTLGSGARMDKRIKWHLAHQKECCCSPIPKTVLAEIKKLKAQKTK